MQREAVEALIQELPKFTLKTVPIDCSECPICLEEFRMGNEVNIFVDLFITSQRLKSKLVNIPFHSKQLRFSSKNLQMPT